MPCIKDKCAICQLYPNTNAGVACDTFCYFDENKEIREHYIKNNAELTKYYKDGK